MKANGILVLCFSVLLPILAASSDFYPVSVQQEPVGYGFFLNDPNTFVTAYEVAKVYNQIQIHIRDGIDLEAYRTFESSSKRFAIFNVKKHYAEHSVHVSGNPFHLQVGQEVYLGGDTLPVVPDQISVQTFEDDILSKAALIHQDKWFRAGYQTQPEIGIVRLKDTVSVEETDKIYQALQTMGYQQSVKVLDEVSLTETYRSKCFLLSHIPKDTPSGIPILNHHHQIAGMLYRYDIEIERPDTIKITLSDVLFDTGKFQLRDEGKEILGRFIDKFATIKEYTVHVEGHTDIQGQPKYNNQALSEQRAANVAEYLAEKGIPKKHIITKGWSFTKPISTNDSEEGMQKNRRVEVLFQSEELFMIIEKLPQGLLIPIAEIVDALPKDTPQKDATALAEHPTQKSMETRLSKALTPVIQLNSDKTYQLTYPNHPNMVLGSPERMVEDSAARVYILDTKYKKIIQWDDAKEYWTEFPKANSSVALKNPVAVAMSSNDMLYVLDEGAKQILLLNTQLDVVHTIPFAVIQEQLDKTDGVRESLTAPMGNREWFAPVNLAIVDSWLICYNHDGDLYILDDTHRFHHRIARDFRNRHPFEKPEQMEAVSVDTNEGRVTYIYLYNPTDHEWMAYRINGTLLRKEKVDVASEYQLTTKEAEPVLVSLKKQTAIRYNLAAAKPQEESIPLFSARSNPSDILFSSHHRLLIAYTDDPMIQIYGDQGEWIRSVTNFGVGNRSDDMFRIQSILRGSDALYALDSRNNIHRFSKDGTIETYALNLLSEKSDPSRPPKMGTTERHHFNSFCLDTTNEKSLILVDSLKSALYRWEFGSEVLEPVVIHPGSWEGQMLNPVLIKGYDQLYWVMDHQRDTLLVFQLDTKEYPYAFVFNGQLDANSTKKDIFMDFTIFNHHLYLLTQDGIYDYIIQRTNPLSLLLQRTIVPKGQEDLSHFSHLEMIDQEMMILSDSVSHRLWLGNVNGTHYTWFGSKGTASDQLNHPSALWVQGNEIDVADENNFRIQHYTLNKPSYLNIQPHHVHMLYTRE